MSVLFAFFFFHDTATTEIYTLSLHDALPISSTASFCTPVIPQSWMFPARSACWAWMTATSGVSAATAVSRDRKSTRLNSSHRCISYAVFCLKKKTKQQKTSHYKHNTPTTDNT